MRTYCGLTDPDDLAVMNQHCNDLGIDTIETGAMIAVLMDNDAVGTNLEPNFFQQLGRETLRLEREFNLAAGFTEADDELPAFFYQEPLAPTHRTARFHGAEVFDIYARLDDVGTEGVPDKYGRAH